MSSLGNRFVRTLVILLVTLFVVSCGTTVKETVVVKETVLVEASPVEKVVTATPAAEAIQVNSVGKQLPPDAKSAEEQVVTVFGTTSGYAEWFKSIYKSCSANEYVQIPLTRIDGNGNAYGDAAESWEVSEDGLTWTFHIRQGLIWSDGSALTAKDFEWSFQRGADPNTGYDFGWLYSSAAGIKNWDAVTAGTVAIEDLGVHATDDYTLVIETTSPRPFLPALMTQSYVSCRACYEQYGDNWSTKLDTMLFSGPFIISEWKPDDRIVLKANPQYNGPFKPYIEQWTFLESPASDAVGATYAAYMAGEIDEASLSADEAALMSADTQLASEIHPYAEYNSQYFFFDTTQEPFNNIKLRQALAQAIDRATIADAIYQGTYLAATTLLPIGFHAYNANNAAYTYNLDAAKQALADAGYPNGEGLPVLQLWIRDGTHQKAAEYLQDQWKKNLGIEIEIVNKTRNEYMDAMGKGEIAFGLVDYGYDYIDASNFMDLFLCSGRQGYGCCDATYDELVNKADSYTGDASERITIYNEAEKYLLEQVYCIPGFHNANQIAWKSDLRGIDLPSVTGATWRGPRLGLTAFTIYRAK